MGAGGGVPGGVSRWAASVASRLLSTLTPRVFIGGNSSSSGKEENGSGDNSGSSRSSSPSAAAAAAGAQIDTARELREEAAGRQKSDHGGEKSGEAAAEKEKDETAEESRERVTAAAAAGAAQQLAEENDDGSGFHPQLQLQQQTSTLAAEAAAAAADPAAASSPAPSSSSSSSSAAKVGGTAVVEERFPSCALPVPRAVARARGLRLLSLEGGGIRGLALIWQLMALERLSGRRVHDMFDLVGGTSTGGILSLAIANRVPLEEVEKLYFEVAKKVFAAKQNGFIRQILTGAQQDSAPLLEILRGVLGEAPMRRDDHAGPHVRRAPRGFALVGCLLLVALWWWCAASFSAFRPPLLRCSSSGEKGGCVPLCVAAAEWRWRQGGGGAEKRAADEAKLNVFPLLFFVHSRLPFCPPPRCLFAGLRGGDPR